MPVSLGGMASYMATVKKDKGFYFVSAVIKCIVGNHVNIYFIVLVMIQAGVLIYVYRKYSSRYLVFFLIYCFDGLHFMDVQWYPTVSGGYDYVHRN